MLFNSDRKLLDDKCKKCFDFGHWTYECTKKTSYSNRLSIYFKFKSANTKAEEKENFDFNEDSGKKEIFGVTNEKINYLNLENTDETDEDEDEEDENVRKINEGINQNIIACLNNIKDMEEDFEASEVDSMPEYNLLFKSGYDSSNKYYWTNREYRDREFKKLTHLDEELKKKRKNKQNTKGEKKRKFEKSQESKKSEDSIEKKKI